MRVVDLAGYASGDNIKDHTRISCYNASRALMTTLAQVRRGRARLGQPMPQNLWIQLDNTAGENKNKTVLGVAAELVNCGGFKSVTVAFLRVGHTQSASLSIMAGCMKNASPK